MGETIAEEPVFYLKNDRGTVVRETDPAEVARLQREAGYSPISVKKGRAAFAKKEKVFEKLDIMFGGELSKAAEAEGASK